MDASGLEKLRCFAAGRVIKRMAYEYNTCIINYMCSATNNPTDKITTFSSRRSISYFTETHKQVPFVSVEYGMDNV